MSRISTQLFLLVLAAVLVITVSHGHAQSATGIPPFGTFQSVSGPDVVNLANLNVHLTIPIVSKNGIGLPFTAQINFDSSVYNSAGQFLTNGFSFSATTAGTIPVALVNGTCATVDNLKWQISGFYDGNNTYHAVPSMTIGYGGTCTSTLSQTTADGSGIAITVSINQNDSITGTLTYPSGIVASGVGCCNVIDVTPVTDTNGHCISSP